MIFSLFCIANSEKFRIFVVQTKLLIRQKITAMENSIWGEIQTKHQLATGVVDVTTAGHGGIIVEKWVANQFLSPEAKKSVSLENDRYHFEEDCDWAIFAFENPTIVPHKWLQYVENCLEKYNPHYIQMAKKKGNYEKRLLKLHEVMGLPTPKQTELFN